jgi:hypothetical protein
MVNVADMLHRHDGRDESGPYDLTQLRLHAMLHATGMTRQLTGGLVCQNKDHPNLPQKNFALSDANGMQTASKLEFHSPQPSSGVSPVLRKPSAALYELE